MVLWFHGAMVPWFGGSNTFPTTLKINLPSMLFKHSPCSLHHHSLLLVRPVTRFGVPTLLNKLSFFPPFRLSFRGTSDLPPFPFSGTYHVMRNNVFRRPNLTGQLYFVCQICWAHVRHVSTLCEPCGGCELLDSIGYDLGYHIL